MTTVYTPSNLATIPLSTTKRLTVAFVLQAKVRIRNAARGNYKPALVERDLFTERCEMAIRRTRFWYLSYFGPDEHMDDTLQEVRVKLWKQYQAERDLMDSAGDGLWVVRARWAAKNARTHVARKGKYVRRYRSDGTLEFIEKVGTLTDPDHLTNDHYEHDSRQVREVDLRMFLADTLKRIFDTLPTSYHEQARILLQGMTNGENVCEIARNQGWNRDTTRSLLQRIRTIARGESDAAPTPKPAIQVNTESVVAKARELRDQGYPYTHIGAYFGKSRTWAVDLLRTPDNHKFKNTDPALVEKISTLRQQGTTWPNIAAHVGYSQSYVTRIYMHFNKA